MYGRIQNTIQAKSAEFPIVFVLVARPFGDLDDETDDFREVGSRIQIVQGGAHQKWPPMLSGGIAKPFVNRE
jgi:hypothetical protein